MERRDREAFLREILDDVESVAARQSWDLRHTVVRLCENWFAWEDMSLPDELRASRDQLIARIANPRVPERV